VFLHRTSANSELNGSPHCVRCESCMEPAFTQDHLHPDPALKTRAPLQGGENACSYMNSNFEIIQLFLWHHALSKCHLSLPRGT
jgi:hypothetical protein